MILYEGPGYEPPYVKLTLVLIRSTNISTKALHEMSPDGAASTNYNETKNGVTVLN